MDSEPVPHDVIPEKVTVRAANAGDAQAIAAILAEAFPTLYRNTFGGLNTAESAQLLNALYKAAHLSLDTTFVCTQNDQVVGVMILHLGQSIGRGLITDYWRLLRREFGLLRAFRAFWGGLFANRLLDRRIPRAPDLVYIEALAVAETCRGQGIGSRLLAEAEHWAHSANRSRLALHVLSSNTGARRLYERVGFHPWHSHASPYSWGAILMERKL